MMQYRVGTRNGVMRTMAKPAVLRCKLSQISPTKAVIPNEQNIRKTNAAPLVFRGTFSLIRKCLFSLSKVIPDVLTRNFLQNTARAIVSRPIDAKPISRNRNTTKFQKLSLFNLALMKLLILSPRNRLSCICNTTILSKILGNSKQIMLWTALFIQQTIGEIQWGHNC